MDIKQMIETHGRTLNYLPFKAYYEFGIKTYPKFMQFGGGKDFQEQFIDEGGVHTYNINIDDSDKKTIMINVFPVSGKGQDCINVMVYTKDHEAIITNMSYYKSCAVEGLAHPGGGTKLLRFILNFLLKSKDKYGIHKILLQDNSTLYCHNTYEKVSLANLKMITDGKTWYMKYGFKPYDPEQRKHSDEIDGYIERNIKIFSRLETGKLNIPKIVKATIRGENETNIKLEDVELLIKKYPLFKEFIKRLILEFDKYCCILIPIMKMLFPTVNGNLLSLHGKTFYLDI